MSECILEFKNSITFLVERTIVYFRKYRYTSPTIYNSLMVELEKPTVTGLNFTCLGMWDKHK